MKIIYFFTLILLTTNGAQAYSFCGCKNLPTSITWKQKLELAKKWQKKLPSYFTYQIRYSEKLDEFIPSPKCSIENKDLEKEIQLKGLYGFRATTLNQKLTNLKTKLGSTSGIAGKIDGAVATSGQATEINIQYEKKLWTGTKKFNGKKSPITIPACYDKNPNNGNIFIVELEDGKLISSAEYLKIKKDEKINYKKSCRSPCTK